MKSESDFQKILETLMKSQAKVESTSSSTSNSDPNVSQPSSAFNPQFLNMDFWQKIYPAGTYQASKTGVDACFAGAPQPAPVQPAPVPQKRIKRKLSFDQLKAVELFKFYGEKNIGDDSTIDEIKMAYRRLAKKFHPDVCGSSGENFKKIAIAYKRLLATGSPS